MRVVMYTRVSKREQAEGYSLDAQRVTILRHLEKQGHALVGEFADEGISAHSDSVEKRPGFRDAIASVSSGQADAIIVHKPDRAARNLRILLDVLHRLGGGLMAVEGDFDYTTPEGKLRAHIMGGVAQWYSDNLARECKKGLEERKRQGLWSGILPYGYRKDEGDKKRPPVPDTAPIVECEGTSWSPAAIVREVFRLSAEGSTTWDIVSRLARINVPMSRSRVDHIVHNRFYLGELPLTPVRQRDTQWTQGKHEALVSLQLFEASMATRKANKKAGPVIRKSANVYALSGLCVCSRCGNRLHARRETYEPYKTWLQCAKRYEQMHCEQPAVKMTPVEEQVEIILETFAPTADLLARAVEIVRADTRDHRHERSALLARKRRLLDLYEWGQIERQEYAAKLDSLEREIAALNPMETVGQLRDLREFLEDLPALYRAASPAQRNALLRRIFVEFLVTDYNIVAVKLQPTLDGALRTNRAARGDAHTVDLSDALTTVGQVHIEPLPDGWWVSPTAQNATPGYRRNRRPIPREWWPKLSEERDAGATLDALAERWGVSRDTICRTLRLHRGLPTKNLRAVGKAGTRV